jgi:uncharacterized membrane protein
MGLQMPFMRLFCRLDNTEWPLIKLLVALIAVLVVVVLVLLLVLLLLLLVMAGCVAMACGVLLLKHRSQAVTRVDRVIYIYIYSIHSIYAYISNNHMCIAMHMHVYAVFSPDHRPRWGAC